MPKTYTVKDVADILGYSTNSIYTFLKEKRIKGVRVGKGRFRIPEEELSRVLHLSKQTQKGPNVPVVAPLTMTQLDGSTIGVPTDNAIVDENIGKWLGTWNGRMNLFDWFIAGVSILIAAAIILVPQMVGNIWGTAYDVWFMPVSVAFGFAGIGLILVNFFSLIHDTAVWRKLFLVILACSYLGFAYVQWVTGNPASMYIFLVLGLSVVAAALWSLTDVSALMLMGFGFAVVTPIIVFYYPQSVWMPWIANLSFIQQTAFLVVWLLGWIVGLVVVWWISGRGNLFFAAVLSAVMSVVVVAFAIYHIEHFRIASSLLMILAAIMLLILPFWRSMQQAVKRGKILAFGAYATILMIFIIDIGVFTMVEQSMLASTSVEMGNRLTYARDELSNYFTVSTRSLESVANNSEFVTSVEKSDQVTGIGMLRSIFEGSGVIRKLEVLDATGQLVWSYPGGAVVQRVNNGFRDYFIQVMDKKMTYVSDVITSDTTGNTPSMVIATPVFNKKKDVIAVLVGNLDINVLQLELGKISSPELNEQFAIADHDTRWIMHPDPKRQFSVLTPSEKIVAQQPERTFVTMRDQNRELVLTGNIIIPNTNWRLFVRSSVTALFSKSMIMPIIVSAGYIVSCLVFIVAVTIYSGIWWIDEQKHKRTHGGGP